VIPDPARLTDYLHHVLQAIDRILSYSTGFDEAAFIGNELVQDAVIRNFEVIGEASHNIEMQFPEFAAAHPELPLAFAYQMRNAIAHGYYRVDLNIVWRTIATDLPDFRALVRAAANDLPASRTADRDPGPC
jgi:uncharacterized protein with HEPN domain